jgi:hypothetical protein
VQATDQASVDLNKFRPPAADCAYVPTEGNGRGGAGVVVGNSELDMGRVAETQDGLGKACE